MKTIRNAACRAGPLALALTPLLACHHRHREVHVAPAHLHESEPNDFVEDANFFGRLFRGDWLVVDGWITDSGADDFDGFAFVSNGPIHVEMRLFTDDPRADLDFCVYDPVADEEVICYLTPDNPEVGAIDVLAGGVEFHLVVESFEGASTYGLEVEVFGLHAAASEPGSGSGSVLASAERTGGVRIAASSVEANRAAARMRAGADHSVFRGYARRNGSADEAEPGAAGLLLLVDPDTGELEQRLILAPR